MPFSRVRYVTICQQFLVTAVVLAVGLSAAGVMTLRIIAPEQQNAAAPRMQSAVHISDETYADTAPVKPKVREVPVSGIDPAAARSVPGLVDQQRAPQARQGEQRARVAPSPEPGLALAVLSKPQAVHGYATVGVTWAHGLRLAEDAIAIQVRTRKDGHWSGWKTAEYHAEHGPDATDEEAARTRPGTDPIVIGDVDEVQMKAETRKGVVPADLQLAVIDPGVGKLSEQQPAIDTAKLPASEKDARTAPIEDTSRLASTPGSAPTSAATPSTDEADQALAGSDLALQAMKVAPRPTIYSRAQWGADESLREQGPPDYGTIKAGFIHHTVNANDYTRAQVPSLLRGIYAYHVLSRGWRDIGYNFLVDRFGRIWEGRYGGVARPVVGAHTLGYNEVSFAMSAIGNFDVARPPQAVVNAYARLFAWKLSMYNLRADQLHVYVKNRYMNRINGHRDVGQTACPGRYLYARIGDVRKAARSIQVAAQTTTSPTPTPTPTPTPVPTDPNSIERPVLGTPADMPSPLSSPRAATAQPQLKLPARLSVAGGPWPDVVTLATDGTVRVVTTSGMLGYGKRTTSPGPWGRMTQVVAIGDVTADGRKDVIARSGRTGWAGVYPGLGSGKVASQAVAGSTDFRHADLIVGVGDWNKDGRRDVISRDGRYNSLYLHLGAGHGKFEKRRWIRGHWDYDRTAFAGDFDRNGTFDLLAWNASDGRLLLWPGKGGINGRTAFGTPRVLGSVGDLTALAGGFDMTGDLNPDVLVRDAQGGTRILENAGNSRLGHTFGPFRQAAGLSSVSVAPMASIRRGDIVGKDASGELVVVANNGRRNVGKVLPGNLDRDVAESVMSVGDWDGDGHSDLITREYDGKRLTLWPGKGDGTFMRGRAMGNEWQTVTQLAAVGDVTGDGNPDLMGSVQGGRLVIWPGNRLKGIKYPVWAPATMRTYNQVGAGGWDTRQPATMYRTGDGAFVPVATPYASVARAARTPLNGYQDVTGVGDVNGDNHADVLARSRTTGDLWLLPGKASGGLGPRMWVADGFAGYRSIG